MKERPKLPDLPAFARGPFYVNPHTLWICGTDEFGGMCHVADIRGWGYLTGKGQALALSSDEAFEAQKKTADFIVAAMNAALDGDAIARIRADALREVLEICECYGAPGELIADEILALIDKEASHDRARGKDAP